MNKQTLCTIIPSIEKKFERIDMNKRFFIGQFEVFDTKRHEREHRDGFKGIEACQFADINDVQRLVDFSNKRDLDFGVHFPLRKGLWRYRDPQYLSKNQSVCKESYDFMMDEFKFISDTGADYVLLHYPKPVILNRGVDWDKCWRFADDTEYYFEDEYSFEEFKERSIEFFNWINSASIRYGIRVFIELDAVNEYLYDTDFLIEMLEKFSNIELCLDIGRLHLQHMIDNEFDAFKFIQRVGSHTSHVHLWNVKVADNVEGGHHPTLPFLDVKDGWADVEEYLTLLNKYSNDYTLLFEHYTGNITDEELQCCYEWIDSLVTKVGQV